jgi:hypothetical protein
MQGARGWGCGGVGGGCCACACTSSAVGARDGSDGTSASRAAASGEELQAAEHAAQQRLPPPPRRCRCSSCRRSRRPRSPSRRSRPSVALSGSAAHRDDVTTSGFMPPARPVQRARTCLPAPRGPAARSARCRALGAWLPLPASTPPSQPQGRRRSAVRAGRPARSSRARRRRGWRPLGRRRSGCGGAPGRGCYSPVHGRSSARARRPCVSADRALQMLLIPSSSASGGERSRW